MRPKTIVHPEALADWRANDEDTHNYLATVQEKINIQRTQDELDRRIQDELDNNAIPKKQKKLDGILALRLKEAIERENRKRREVRKERKA